MRVLGLVTARGGSKGLPGKNLARIAGRPLVAWAHRALDQLRERRPGLVLRLSTDDPAIAGAWPAQDRPDALRPAALARDDSTSLEVVDYELGRMREAGEACDAVLLLQPTTPLLTVDDLDAMWARFEGGCASVVAVGPWDHPPRWAVTMDGGGRLGPLAEWSDAPRQGEGGALRPVGAYLCSTGFLSERRAFIVPGESVGVVVPRERAVDIDTGADLGLARVLLASSRAEARIELGDRAIGAGEAVLVIAEAGVNHNGDPALARQLVDAAAEAGADAVKFQTFDPALLVKHSARMAAYQRDNLGIERGQLDMLSDLRLDDRELPGLKAYAEARGLVFLSSPFDLGSARLLRDLGVPALKIGSGELTNHPFLAGLAGLGLPLLLSTGMSTLDECEDAAAVVRGNGNPPVAWLHCVSAYPAPESSTNLRAMDSLRAALGGPVGLSDHSLGVAVAVAGAARGARVIEKHLTLDRTLPGPDHAASLEPGEFASMVGQIRLVESALGDGIKAPAPCELDTIRAARRSLVTTRDLPAGHVLTLGDLTTKRPATGLAPAMLRRVVGRRLARAVEADQTLAHDDLA
jgi:N-acetylneuraminate synthase/N,N'-diacetyllegionaminate synthase